MPDKSRQPLTFRFEDNGAVPNNPSLPALVYKAAIDLSGSSDPEAAIEKMFAANGWGRDMWRDGIFPYLHYHSMIHEALGVARGTATVRLGGDDGEVLEFSAGDVAVLPAGTGHQRLKGSDDFRVVGAYPPEGTYNLFRGGNDSQHDEALTTIPSVPVPRSDPVHGKDGPLPTLWKRS
ncbi:MAG TPA: hypothetical protein VHV58_00990 [Pseudolabrys sp.]|nr:hypothetical protein [Pseudolabrys sp.]